MPDLCFAVSYRDYSSESAHVGRKLKILHMLAVHLLPDPPVSVAPRIRPPRCLPLLLELAASGGQQGRAALCGLASILNASAASGRLGVGWKANGA